MAEYPSLSKEMSREVPADLKGTVILLGPRAQHVQSGCVALEKSSHLSQPAVGRCFLVCK